MDREFQRQALEGKSFLEAGAGVEGQSRSTKDSAEGQKQREGRVEEDRVDGHDNQALESSR